MKLRVLLFLFVGLLIIGCKSKKKIADQKRKTRTERVVKRPAPKPIEETLPGKTDEHEMKELPPKASYEEILNAYVDTYSQIAMEEMLQYGIPASITLAQGILESGAGRGELTRRANNHFGIKCHSSWKGDRVYHDDDEKGECFRKYKDAKYSFRDHSLFLAERSRYQKLFQLRKNDYKGWARGLKAAGYATDPRYPDKLIRIIEKNDLTRFDQQVLGGTAQIMEEDNSHIKTYTVRKGDTLYSIARRHNMTVETLMEYNGLQSSVISVGQVLYLHSVKDR